MRPRTDNTLLVFRALSEVGRAAGSISIIVFEQLATCCNFLADAEQLLAPLLAMALLLVRCVVGKSWRVVLVRVGSVHANASRDDRHGSVLVLIGRVCRLATATTELTELGCPDFLR